MIHRLVNNIYVHYSKKFFNITKFKLSRLHWFGLNLLTFFSDTSYSASFGDFFSRRPGFNLAAAPEKTNQMCIISEMCQ